MERGVFVWDQPHTYRKGAGPSLPNFGGSVLFMQTRPVTHKFDVVTHMGGGLFLRGQLHPHPKGTGSQLSQFSGSFLFMRT